MSYGPVTTFIKHHYRHFNAASLLEAADAFVDHLDRGGVMFLTLAGAMSTAELGVSLAEMIRQEKVHAICCTGANLEEDVFNLVAHDLLRPRPQLAGSPPEDEQALLDRNMNRVTDTCIPEQEAMRRIERVILKEWTAADGKSERYFPHEFFYRILRAPTFGGDSKSTPKIAGSTRQWSEICRSLFRVGRIPRWAICMPATRSRGDVKNVHTVRTGIEYMISLAAWYDGTAAKSSIGFFQIGGGIAGDFPICVVPMMRQDLQRASTPLWGYFCQISDSTTSYGSYSGAIPNEKITWEKLGIDTPKFVIESDASIVAPLVFARVLNW